jgi:hypothetical protein
MNSITFPVQFEGHSARAGFGFYTFRFVPQIGDEVLGEDAVYEMKHFVHSEGIGINAKPMTEIVLKYLRPIPED